MEFEVWQIGLIAVVGVASGFLNVVAGGGSLLTVPVMVFLGMPGPVANGTNRIGILAQNITSVVTFARSGFKDFKLSLSLSACAIPGAIAGALLGVNLEGVWFNRSLALIMLGVMLVMHFDRKPTERVQNYQPTKRQLLHGHLLMVGVGFWGGFIQLGVGFIIMPVLNRVMGLDLVRTNMHKVFIIAVYTVVALAIFANQLELLWVVGIALAVGNSIGGYLGSRFAISKGEHMIRRVLNLVLVVFVIKLLVDF
ncbi:putative membrane transporter protein YfcA [Halioglobus japonicus]|nr:putative membrane transporter protein YfcA [Halioglobus japonicus]